MDEWKRQNIKTGTVPNLVHQINNQSDADDLAIPQRHSTLLPVPSEPVVLNYRERLRHVSPSVQQHKDESQPFYQTTLRRVHRPTFTRSNNANSSGPIHKPSVDIALHAPTPIRHIPTATIERNSEQFSTRTQSPANSEIVIRRNRRPFVRRACGHVERTANVPIPGGNDIPSMIEQGANGSYILVGPKIRRGLDEGETDVESGEVIPVLCSRCQVGLGNPSVDHTRKNDGSPSPRQPLSPELAWSSSPVALEVPDLFNSHAALPHVDQLWERQTAPHGILVLDKPVESSQVGPPLRRDTSSQGHQLSSRSRLSSPPRVYKPHTFERFAKDDSSQHGQPSRRAEDSEQNQSSLLPKEDSSRQRQIQLAEGNPNLGRLAIAPAEGPYPLESPNFSTRHSVMSSEQPVGLGEPVDDIPRHQKDVPKRHAVSTVLPSPESKRIKSGSLIAAATNFHTRRILTPASSSTPETLQGSPEISLAETERPLPSVLQLPVHHSPRTSHPTHFLLPTPEESQTDVHQRRRGHSSFPIHNASKRLAGKRTRAATYDDAPQSPVRVSSKDEFLFTERYPRKLQPSDQRTTSPHRQREPLAGRNHASNRVSQADLTSSYTPYIHEPDMLPPDELDADSPSTGANDNGTTTAEIVQSLDNILTDHSLMLRGIISALSDAIPKMERASTLWRKLHPRPSQEDGDLHMRRRRSKPIPELRRLMDNMTEDDADIQGAGRQDASVRANPTAEEERSYGKRMVGGAVGRRRRESRASVCGRESEFGAQSTMESTSRPEAGSISAPSGAIGPHHRWRIRHQSTVLGPLELILCGPGEG